MTLLTATPKPDACSCFAAPQKIRRIAGFGWPGRWLGYKTRETAVPRLVAQTYLTYLI